MPINKQQSSILTEQELQLLASQFAKPQNFNFAVYSYHLPLEFDNYHVYQTDTIEELILMLSASSRGSALVLPDSIESHPFLDKLLELLKFRADIQIFWVGQMPSMELDIPAFEYCFYLAHLLHNLNSWRQHVEYMFSQWLQEYRVAFITENRLANNKQQSVFASIGLQQVEYFDASSSTSAINNMQLLIIDLSVDGLPFVDLLNHLASREAFPILILFGELPANLCRSAYNLAQNKGFSILACLSSAPDKKKWQHLLHSLYSKVYLKHWITPSPVKKMAYGIYNIESQNLDGYFCLYGISKKQIAQLAEREKVQKIISVHSLLDWFPRGIRSEIREQLADELNCEFKQVGIYIEEPGKIRTTSVLYATLLIAGLSHFRIYWLVGNETQLSTDILKNFPISDIILSEKISHHLLGEPSDELLHFIKQAKQQKIRLGATLQQNQAADDAMALYGIEFIVNQQE